MKNKVILLFLCFATVLGQGCASAPLEAKVSQNTGFTTQVTESRGRVEVIQNGQWKPAIPGTSLQQGDGLRTGAGSDASLSFGKFGGIARVNPESEIWMQHLGWTNEPSGRVMLVIIDLRAGRITGDTLNPAANSRFMIKTAGGMFELK